MDSSDKSSSSSSPHPFSSEGRVGAEIKKSEETESKLLTDWQKPEEEKHEPLSPQKKMSFLKIILTFSIIFFIIAAFMTAYVFFGGRNVVSSDNIVMSVTGPASIKGGDNADFDVTLSNNNNSDLEDATLAVNYPEGTRKGGSGGDTVVRESEKIGTFRAGATVKKHFSVSLFGEENSTKEIGLVLEYHVNGSNAPFTKESTYPVLLSSSPVTMSVQSFSEANSGQALEFTIELNSNSTEDIHNILVRADYPFGFQFTSSSRTPYDKNNVWNFPIIHPGEKNTFKVKGTLTGQDGDKRVFKFALGMPQTNDERKLGALYGTASREITLKKPFIGAELSIDGVSGKDMYVAKAGKEVRADIFWSNNTSSAITDAQIIVKLSGNALNKSAVASERGFYRSGDTSIVWDKDHVPALASVAPGASGQFSFTFTPLSFSSGAKGIKEPQVDLDISIKGNRLSDMNVPQEISSAVSRKVAIATDLGLTPRIVYSTGPFTNSGPIPPKAEKETSYTIVWTITNTVNSAANVAVTAKLPSYVKWLDHSAPSTERVKYNAQANTVTWDLGTVQSGAGFSSSARAVSFQVSLLPSTSQVGTAPVVLSGITVLGEDYFTGSTLQFMKGDLTTRISTDPIFTDDIERVVR